MKDTDNLEDDLFMFKLIGSVLVKWDISEDRVNVDRHYLCARSMNFMKVTVEE